MNYIQKLQEGLSSKILLRDDEHQLLDLYTLLIIVKGEECTMEDIHDAWSIWTNRRDSEHRSLIPFKELSEEIQEYDREYMNAIHKAS